MSQSEALRVDRLVLASTSPYRQALLKGAGLSFETCASAVDEAKIHAATPRDVALARAEAKSLAPALTHSLVIGADQVLGMNGRVFDKAKSRQEARERLRAFSGGTHTLHSAFVLAYALDQNTPARILHREVVDVPMTMRTLSAEEIERYLDTGEWQGCVGCYQAENRGVHLFESYGGDSSAIIGLPLPQLLTALRRLGINQLLAPTPPWRIGKTTEIS